MNVDAQTDTVLQERHVPKYLLHEQLIRDPDQFRLVDTGLSGLQYYDPGYLRNLGRIGTPVFPLRFKTNLSDGFTFGFDQWDVYRYTVSSMPYFNTHNPYTDFSYMQGQSVAQEFGVVHSQNITPYWNTSVHYNRLSYGNRNSLFTSALNNIGLNTWYRSPSRRYMAASSFILNRFNADETGGILSDSVYRATATSLKNEAPVHLDDATQLWKDKNFMLQQFLYFGRSEERKIHDTDSVAVKILYPRLYVSHRIDYYENQFVYRDTIITPGFYPAIYIDSMETEDQYWYNNWINEVSIGRTAAPVPWLQDVSSVFMRGYGRIELIKARENLTDSSLQNFIIGGEATKYGVIRADLTGRYTISGWNGGDHFVSAKLTVPFLSFLHLPQASVGASVGKNEPSYIAQYLTSNHFRWNKDLEKVQEIKFRAELFDTSSIFNTGVEYVHANNQIYYDTLAIVQQFTAGLDYLQVFLRKDFRVGSFHLNEDLIYQKVLNTDIIRLPEILSRTSLYYQGWWFKKALLAKIGIDLSYNTAYYSYNYMPGISKFFLQDTVQTGNYPVFDVWFTAKVKTFRFMVKLEHLNQGFTGYDYFLLPRYPISPRGLRLGLRWTFYN